ncbi:prolyl oligopeptidase family serine peptidase [Trueperella bernardiae]|uniref:prolyl oligopeptidase family serine peptidase n=1 Tax=Trueperella bernardiae TaxID=59561 RepID=UPI00294A1D76|nr:prolyl oligopeptidase family serine peptidase [Trueperella bernardiae]MDV6239164.1 prolyl oligopeptidase family serine peptidase [Trueperella bernardiae]
MKPALISQFENLFALTNEAVRNKWARHGEWWYYSDSTTGLLMRVPISNPDDWDLEEHDMQRLRLSAQPVFNHDQTQHSEVISQDISSNGSYACSATRSLSDRVIRLSVRDVASQRVVFSKSLHECSLDRVYLSRNGEIVYFTCVSSPRRSKSLWAIRVDNPKAESPKRLFAGMEGNYVGVSRTTSQRFLKVIHTSSLHRVFTLIDLDAPQINSGVEVTTGLTSKHYTFEHLECEGIDFALVIEHGDTASEGKLSCFSLNDNRVMGVRCSFKGDVNQSLTCASSVYLGKESVVAFLPDGLSVDVVVFSYRYCGIGGLVLEARSTVHLPANVDSALMRPLDWQQPYVDISISSLVAPPELLRIPLNRRLWKRQSPSSSVFDVLAKMKESRYGIVRTLGRLDGNSPAGLTIASSTAGRQPAKGCLVVGYGAYGRSLPRGFNPLYAMMLERGVDIAVAHVRGGGEFGVKWHQQGAKLHKLDSIGDFLDVCEYIKTNGTRLNPDYKVFALGASAGGLLVAAAANMSPGLFDSLILIAPFVSPLRALMDPDDPLAVTDWKEYGNPISDLDIRKYIAGYSPLENIPPVRMPDVFLALNELDNKVNNRHALEWVDRMRATGSHIELEIRPGADHAGSWSGASASQIRILEWITKRLT